MTIIPTVGSSGGSAVAVSANMVPVSLGTETDTSVIGPASINGVVGIKPTVGLTSRSGVIPISENLDTVGVFGRNMLDACIALSAIVGIDEHDPATSLCPSESRTDDYRCFLTTKRSLKGARFGLPINRCWDEVPDDIRAAGAAVLDALKRSGATIVDTDFPCWHERIPSGGNWDWEFGPPSESEFTVVQVDAYKGINAYLAQCSGTKIKTLEDVVAYNQANRGTEGAFPGDHAAFASGQLKQVSVDRSCDVGKICVQFLTPAGYPIITIPVGVDSKGIPIGLSLHQTAWKEPELVKWASAIEDMMLSEYGQRKTPSYRNYMAKNIPILPVSD
ncbi:MAG: hypothetical protein Q9160_008142 [Pyrenula sp. 1 TL-2023]